jgi:hypothetical protein
MKEPYIEGVATHDGPESCAGARKGAREAFDRGTCGLDHATAKRRKSGVPTRLANAVRQHERHRYREMPGDPARSKNLARAESFCARTGRPLDCPREMVALAASERPQAASR